MDLTTIHLTEEEAKTFLIFQKHRDIINILDESGFFSLINGSCEIHKDIDGKIRVVDIHRHFRM